MTAKPQSLPGRSSGSGNKPIMSVRLIPGCYSAVRINIEPGEPDADIRLNRADIRHPEPFDTHGLTDACRTYIQNAVQHAVEKDGHLRSITWSDAPSQHHGGQHD